MPYLVTAKKGDKIEVTGIATLFCQSEDLKMGVSLVKVGEFSDKGEYNESNEIIVDSEEFHGITCPRRYPIKDIEDLSLFSMVILFTKSGEELFLFKTVSGLYL